MQLRNVSAPAAWKKGFEEAKKYFEEHGDLLVPQKYVSPSGYHLGAWITNQRRRHENLKTYGYQAYLLERIGMVWKPFRRWEETFPVVLEYVRQHNGGSWSVSAETQYKGVYVSQWIGAQRHGHKIGKLTEKKAKLLSDAGMPW